MDRFCAHDGRVWCDAFGSSIFLVSVASLGALLIWRVWKFTVQPALSPQYAQKLPYFVPGAFDQDALPLLPTRSDVN